MERCYHKKENNVLMVGTTADGAAVYCNAYDNKTKTFCKKLKNACAIHATKRHPGGASVGVLEGGPGVPANGTSRRVPTLTCGCPTGDFQSGYLVI